MGISYNATATTRGLLCCVDVANIKSYSGSGTTITDLTGKSNNGAMTGCTYNSGNKGYFVFDGSTSYIDLGANITPTISSTQQITICSTVYLSSIVSKPCCVSLNGGYSFFFPGTRILGNSQMFWDGGGWKTGNTSSYATGVWYYFGWTINGTTLTFYANGIADGVSTSTVLNPSGNTRIGLANAGEYVAGSLSTVQIYSVALTADEMYSNFMAIRGRFGI